MPSADENIRPCHRGFDEGLTKEGDLVKVVKAVNLQDVIKAIYALI
jgi:hypothetical protein